MAGNDNGFFALGDVLGGGGGGGTGSEAYLQGLRGGYQAQEAMSDAEKAREEARLMRSRNIARESIPDALAQADYLEKLQPLLQAVLLSNNTVDLDQLGDLAVPQAGAAFEAAAAAAATGDTEGQNRQTALAAGKPFEPFELAAGGKAVFNPGSGAVDLTALGDAAFGSEQALAASREASAAASRARRDHTVDTTENPERYRAPPKADTPAGAPTEAEVLADARAAIAEGGDIEAIRKRLRDRGYTALAEKL